MKRIKTNNGIPQKKTKQPIICYLCDAHTFHSFLFCLSLSSFNTCTPLKMERPVRLMLRLLVFPIGEQMWHLSQYRQSFDDHNDWLRKKERKKKTSHVDSNSSSHRNVCKRARASERNRIWNEKKIDYNH